MSSGTKQVHLGLDQNEESSSFQVYIRMSLQSDYHSHHQSGIYVQGSPDPVRTVRGDIFTSGMAKKVHIFIVDIKVEFHNLSIIFTEFVDTSITINNKIQFE